MNPQDRIECCVLKPADKQFPECGIGWAAEDESANVGSPVGNSGQREVQAGGYLSAIAEPVGIDVAGPRGHAVPLRARECRSRKNEYALLVRGAALSLVDGLRVEQWVNVDVPVATSGGQLVIEQDVLFL